MTTLRSCFNCAFEAGHCGERDKLRAAIRGLGLTSVKHRCDWRRDRFRFGQAVTVETATYMTDYGDDLSMARFPATFIQYSFGGGKCVCFIASGTKSEYGDAFTSKDDEDGGYVKVPRRRVNARDGAAAPVCTRCRSAVPDKCSSVGCPFHGWQREAVHGLWRVA